MNTISGETKWIEFTECYPGERRLMMDIRDTLVRLRKDIVTYSQDVGIGNCDRKHYAYIKSLSRENKIIAEFKAQQKRIEELEAENKNLRTYWLNTVDEE